MPLKAKPIPDGYHNATPYLIVRKAAEAIEFYKNAFGARERFRIPGPNGLVMHSEIIIGDSIFMIADEFGEMSIRSPQALKGTSVSFMLYVENVDKIFEQALEAGGVETRPVKDHFYGDRAGNLVDPFGHKWTIATHIEDVTPEEMEERMKAEHTP